MINSQKYEISVQHESFSDIKATVTHLDKDRNALPNASPQTCEVKSSGVSENEKSQCDNFETQVKKECAVREAVTWYEETLAAVRTNISADPGIGDNINDQPGAHFSKQTTIFQNSKISEQTKGEIWVLFRKLSNEVLDSKNLKFVETMSNVEYGVGDKSQNLMNLTIKHAFIDIDVTDVARDTWNVNLRQSGREWPAQLQKTSIPLGTRALAVNKLGILPQTGLYENNPLGKDIKKTARNLLCELQFKQLPYFMDKILVFQAKLEEDLKQH
jgi:hypothetical protein